MLETPMKKTLLATTALFILLSGAASASALIDTATPKLGSGLAGNLTLADKGSDDGADHDSNDDHGGSSGSDDNGGDDSDDDNDDDSHDSDSGRSKTRVPGGSGCDDAGDIAEHPECKPSNG
jgi:hypothetical protein